MSHVERFCVSALLPLDLYTSFLIEIIGEQWIKSHAEDDAFFVQPIQSVPFLMPSYWR